MFESEFGKDERVHKLRLRDAKLETTEYAVCLRDRRDMPVVRAFLTLLPNGAAG